MTDYLKNFPKFFEADGTEFVSLPRETIKEGTMTKEETIQALKDGLEAVGIDSPLRLTLINAIEYLSATTEDGVKGAYIRRNRYTKENVLHGFDVTCDAVQKFKDGDRLKIIIVKEDGV